MVMHIDPRSPLVWRDPSSLQFGIDDPLVVISEVTSAQERMISALVSGVSRSGLEMIARSAHALPGELEDLVGQLEPVLAERVEPARGSVHIAGAGPTADHVTQLLRSSGVELGDDLAGFAVLLGHYVIAPELYGRWLRRDIPHLPVVYGDSTVRIGPVVEPGAGPCLYCLERYRTEADAAWPAIASQLWGRHSPLETPLLAAEIAAIVTRILLERLAHGPALTAEAVLVDAATGARETRTWLPHPECGCIEVAEAPATGVRVSAALPVSAGLPVSASLPVSAGLPGSATPPAPIRLLPRRVEDADVHA